MTKASAADADGWPLKQASSAVEEDDVSVPAPLAHLKELDVSQSAKINEPMSRVSTPLPPQATMASPDPPAAAGPAEAEAATSTQGPAELWKQQSDGTPAAIVPSLTRSTPSSTEESSIMRTLEETTSPSHRSGSRSHAGSRPNTRPVTPVSVGPLLPDSSARNSPVPLGLCSAKGRWLPPTPPESPSPPAIPTSSRILLGIRPPPRIRPNPIQFVEGWSCPTEHPAGRADGTDGEPNNSSAPAARKGHTTGEGGPRAPPRAQTDGTARPSSS